MEKTYTLTLSEKETQLIINVLVEQPFKISSGIINKIGMQVKEQSEKKE